MAAKSRDSLDSTRTTPEAMQRPDVSEPAESLACRQNMRRPGRGLLKALPPCERVTERESRPSDPEVEMLRELEELRQRVLNPTSKEQNTSAGLRRSVVQALPRQRRLAETHTHSEALLPGSITDQEAEWTNLQNSVTRGPRNSVTSPIQYAAMRQSQCSHCDDAKIRSLVRDEMKKELSALRELRMELDALTLRLVDCSTSRRGSLERGRGALPKDSPIFCPSSSKGAPLPGRQGFYASARACAAKEGFEYCSSAGEGVAVTVTDTDGSLSRRSRRAHEFKQREKSKTVIDPIRRPGSCYNSEADVSEEAFDSPHMPVSKGQQARRHSTCVIRSPERQTIHKSNSNGSKLTKVKNNTHSFEFQKVCGFTGKNITRASSSTGPRRASSAGSHRHGRRHGGGEEQSSCVFCGASAESEHESKCSRCNSSEHHPEHISGNHNHASSNHKEHASSNQPDSSHHKDCNAKGASEQDSAAASAYHDGSELSLGNTITTDAVSDALLRKHLETGQNKSRGKTLSRPPSLDVCPQVIDSSGLNTDASSFNPVTVESPETQSHGAESAHRTSLLTSANPLPLRLAGIIEILTPTSIVNGQEGASSRDLMEAEAASGNAIDAQSAFSFSASELKRRSEREKGRERGRGNAHARASGSKMCSESSVVQDEFLESPPAARSNHRRHSTTTGMSGNAYQHDMVSEFSRSRSNSIDGQQPSENITNPTTTTSPNKQTRIGLGTHDAAHRGEDSSVQAHAPDLSQPGSNTAPEHVQSFLNCVMPGSNLHIRRTSAEKKQISVSKRHLWNDMTFDDDDADDGEWVKVSGNAFGAFIHVALQSGLISAFIKTGPMVLASLMIQGIFSEELISQHIETVRKPLNDHLTAQICWVPVKLQISALLIFITLMFHNIPGMINAFRLAFFCTHHKGGDGEFTGDLGTENDNHDLDTVHHIKCSKLSRFVIFVFAVLSEMLSWSGILLAGILFAFTAESVDLVIRSTVSVMFVLNIDEIVFEACCPSSVKDDVEETEYRLPNIQGWMTPKIEHYVSHYYGVYVHLPLLLICSSVTIFVLRIFFLGCEQHPLWQSDHQKGLAAWPGGLPDAIFPT